MPNNSLILRTSIAKLDFINDVTKRGGSTGIYSKTKFTPIFPVPAP